MAVESNHNSGPQKWHIKLQDRFLRDVPNRGRVVKWMFLWQRQNHRLKLFTFKFGLTFFFNQWIIEFYWKITCYIIFCYIVTTSMTFLLIEWKLQGFFSVYNKGFNLYIFLYLTLCKFCTESFWQILFFSI